MNCKNEFAGSIPHNNEERRKLRDCLNKLLETRYEMRIGIIITTPYCVWDNEKEKVVGCFGTEKEALNKVKELNGGIYN